MDAESRRVALQKLADSRYKFSLSDEEIRSSARQAMALANRKGPPPFDEGP